MPRSSDLVGKRFGRLTVVRKTEEKQDGYLMWECRCDCGNKIAVNTKRLKRGTVTNCGCIAKKNARQGSIAEDLTGRRFGKLTAIRRIENKNGRTAWLCQCSCGNQKAVTAHDLKAGKVRSCGCMTYEHIHKIADIKGQRFGRLTALYPTEKRDNKGSVYWHCICECGNETDVSESQLVHGNYKSCGCLKKELQKNIRNQLHMIDGTCIEWLEKRKHRSDNTSGFRGVSRMKNGKYRADIGFKRKRFYIGVFDDYNDAVEARLSAEEKIHEGFVNAYHVWNRQASEDSKWADENPFVFEVRKQNGDFVIETQRRGCK